VELQGGRVAVQRNESGSLVGRIGRVEQGDGSSSLHSHSEVVHICSPVRIAEFVEIRITAFYEFARIHNTQSIQRRRFLRDLWISAILRHNSLLNLRLFLTSKFSVEFLRRFLQIYCILKLAAVFLDLLCG
jgi:hypothetical protein